MHLIFVSPEISSIKIIISSGFLDIKEGFLSRPRRTEFVLWLLFFLNDCSGSKNECFTCWNTLLGLHSFPLCQRAEFALLNLEGQLIFWLLIEPRGQERTFGRPLSHVPPPKGVFPWRPTETRKKSQPLPPGVWKCSWSFLPSTCWFQPRVSVWLWLGCPINENCSLGITNNPAEFVSWICPLQDTRLCGCKLSSCWRCSSQR